jgi:tight adherence protein C
MTPALALAVTAAVLGAVGTVDLAVAVAQRGRAGTGRRAPRLRNAALRLAALGHRLGVPAPPADLGRRLDAAGLRSSVSTGDVMAVKCGGAPVGLLAALPLTALLPGRLGPLALVAAPVAAFLLPDAWLARRSRVRGARMEEELAGVVDLLRVAVEAGLPVPRAIAEVGRRHQGVLAAELRAAAARMSLGVRQADALDTLVRRCPPAGVAAVVAAVHRAERHGAPIGPALAAVAADARAHRAQAIRERAARAAPKIQLVVALLLVPAVMLLVAAALAAGLT